MSGNAVVEFDTRQGLTLLSFESGVSVAGKLVALGPKEMEVPIPGTNRKERKRVTCYTVEERDGGGYDEATGKLFQFPAYADIKDKIRASDVGKLVIVTCTGENPEFTKNGKAMKTFDVKMSRGKAPVIRTEQPATADDLTITDDDIPF